MEDSLKTISLRRLGGVLEVELCRPQVRNAFNGVMLEELSAVFEQAGRDEVLRLLCLAVRGPVLFAGAELQGMQQAGRQSQEENLAGARKMARLFQALEAMPMPTLVTVKGAALGGGAGLVACADMALCTPETRFGFTEVRLGLVPAVISAFVLRRISRAAARRYFLTGEIFKGGTAQRLGLVSEVLPEETLLPRRQELIDAILSAGPAAVRRAKALVEEVLRAPYPAILEETACLIATLRGSPEAREGMEAFLEKRPPAWKEASR